MNLPLVNRDLYSLLSITGGVTSNENAQLARGPEQHTTINGSQQAQIGTVNFQLDGGNNTAGLRGTGNPAPNPEAIQEFRVITNNYAAEYGRYPAGIVDVVTKSGTNQFHGAAFEFFRDESLNAKRWAPPGVDAATGSARSASIRRGAAAGRSGGRRRSSSRATQACARRRPTIATPRSFPTEARAGGRLLSVRDQAADPLTGALVSRRSDSFEPARPGGDDDPGAFRSSVQPAEQLLRGEPARPAQQRRGERSSWITR